MLRRILMIICSIFIVSGSALAAEKGTTTAHADIVGTDGKKIGIAKLTEAKNGVNITVEVSGLARGQHGMHIHETGSCTPPDFKSAGNHFNPLNKKHGTQNPAGEHIGDLPNLIVMEDGKGDAKALARGATLRKGKTSLLKEGGTAIVIHAQPDDYQTDPAGNSGSRVACGVIVKGK